MAEAFPYLGITRMELPEEPENTTSEEPVEEPVDVPVDAPTQETEEETEAESTDTVTE